ncbi:hypothetical protein ONZ45_g13174 [Pleurotus djamor]|nr:hypothetical protein ONZ45_g13174 [Pleurotus djamor]
MGNKSLLTFFREQLSTVPPVVTADLAGKVVLVIGANAGIGYETAKHFAKFGAKVILGCRNKSKGEDAVRRMREETGLDAFDLRIIDLASFDSVKAFVDNFDYDKLDILVANAGIIPKDYEETQDGWEMSLQVNYLSQVLLILLLLPKITKAAELRKIDADPLPRIVIVASEAHQFVDIPKKVYDSTSVLESISSKELSLPYQTLPKYRIAKALNVIITRALSARLASSSNSPIVACVNPGLCYSDMTTNGDSLVFRILLAILGRSAEEGSRQVIWASIGGPTKSSGGNGSERVLGRVDDEAMKGVYVSFAKIEEPGDFVISEKGKEFENLVWDDTLRVLSKIDERVHPIIEKHSLRR